MPTPSQAQLDELDRYVHQNPTWKIPEKAHRATIYINNSPESGWFLHLIPCGGELWRAEVHQEWADKSLQETEGGFEECTFWLKRRQLEFTAESDQAQALRDFADNHKGWKFYDSREGRRYAGRVFEYPKHGSVLLSVQPNGFRRRWLEAQVNVAFAAGPEASITGELDDVEEWVGHWEKILSLPLLLAECKTVNDAAEMAAKMPDRMIAQLSYVLEFDVDGGYSSTRRKLVQEFGPKPSGGGGPR